MKRFIAGLLAAVALASCSGHAAAPKAHHGFFGWGRTHGHVELFHYHNHKLKDYRDLGYGTITNVGALELANDGAWAAPSGAAINTLAIGKYCATGTGSSAAAATDMALQTADTAGVATGTIALAPVAFGSGNQSETVTCTISYSGTENVNEWGLFNASALTLTSTVCSGCSWTSATGTTGTVTGGTMTASSSTAQGAEGYVFEDTTKSPAIYGLALSNTTTIVTVPAWYNVTNGLAAGTSPASTDTLVVKPVLIDHQVFLAPVGVVNGDSIKVTFSWSFPSGG